MTDIVSNVINAFVAIGTIAMAVYTRQTVQATKKSIDDTNNALEAANRTARATEENAERMKDALMPFLDLSVRIGRSVESNGAVTENDRFHFVVQNKGTGPAIIRALTSRDDLKHIRPWELVPVSKGAGLIGDEQLADLTIGPGEAFTFLLPYYRDKYSDQEENLSSLSLFYEDIYGRLSRSRLVYIYRKWNEENQVLPLNREHLTPNQIPDLSTAGSGQVEEGGPPCTYVSVFQSLYLLASVEKKLGTCLEASTFTSDRPVRVTGIRFGFDGFPIIDVEVDEYPTFRLDSYCSDRQHRVVRMLSTNGSTPSAFNVHGLVPNGTDDSRNLLLLYQKLCSHCADVPMNVLSPLFI